MLTHGLRLLSTRGWALTRLRWIAIHVA
jgi:hypothetical protein